MEETEQLRNALRAAELELQSCVSLMFVCLCFVYIMLFWHPLLSVYIVSFSFIYLFIYFFSLKDGAPRFMQGNLNILGIVAWNGNCLTQDYLPVRIMDHFVVAFRKSVTQSKLDKGATAHNNLPMDEIEIIRESLR